MKEIYQEKIYSEKNPTWHEEDSPWKATNILKILDKNNIKPNNICEVGCGVGEILNQLQKKMENSVDFTGYEFSPYAFEIANKKSNSKLNFIEKDIFELDTIQYDVLMAIDVFEHVEDYFYFLRKMKNKGKYKIFHIPIDLSVSSILRPNAIVNAREKVGHIHFFTKEIAFSALKDTGHEIIDWTYTARSIDLPTNSFKTKIAKIPRNIAFKINKKLAVQIFGGFSIMVLTK